MRTLRDDILASADPHLRTVEGGQGYELTFRPGPDFIAFSGHFPGHPVLPAFVQLLMGQCALQIRTARDWRLRRVGRAKFLKTIRPDQPVTVCWNERPLDDGLRGHFTLMVDGHKAAAFTIEFAVEGGPGA